MIPKYGGCFLSLILSVAMLAGCGPNQKIIESARENPPVDVPNANIQPAESSLEKDIEAMKTADFYFIYVFRRKDDAAFTDEDRQFLAANIPTEINRRLISDSGKALVAGSNFRIPEPGLAALKERFAFEDHSRPESELPQNARGVNTNSAS